MVTQGRKRCYLCGATKYTRRRGKVRDDPSLDIYECQNCGLVFLSRSVVPEGFYEQSSMHGVEPPPVDERLRDTDRDDGLCLKYLSKTNQDILDFSCGASDKH